MLARMTPAVFYRPEMVAEVASFSPSARKPREVVASWRKLASELDVRAPEPVSVDVLSECS